MEQTYKLLLMIMANQIKHESMLLILLQEQAKLNALYHNTKVDETLVEKHTKRIQDEIIIKNIEGSITLAHNFIKLFPDFDKTELDNYIKQMFS